MNKFLFPIILLLFLSACNKAPEETWPEDLDGLKTLMSAKKSEIATLQADINKITESIIKLDPTLQEKAKLVDTVHLVTAQVNRYIEIQGTIISDNVANVVSEVPGRITSLRVKEGDYVSKGQLIATIDLESLDKQIAEVETSLTLAKDVYERQARLWDQKIGSEMQYLQAKNKVEQLEKTLQTINFQQTKANVYAPISGAVDIEYMKQGEVASPGMPIVQILNTSNLKVSTDLPEKYLKIAKKGAIVGLNFPSIDLETTGRITLVGRTINSANRTLKLEITPLRKSNLFKPNLLAELRIKELTEADVITVPLKAIMQEVDGKAYVYVAESIEENEWRAIKKYVTMGEATENDIIISNGLEADAILITTGARNLSNDELIKLNGPINE